MGNTRIQQINSKLLVIINIVKPRLSTVWIFVFQWDGKSNHQVEVAG